MALEYASGKSEASFLVHSCKTESDVRLVLPHCLPRRDDLTVEVGKAHQIIIDKDVSIHAPSREAASDNDGTDAEIQS